MCIVVYYEILIVLTKIESQQWLRSKTCLRSRQILLERCLTNENQKERGL